MPLIKRRSSTLQEKGRTFSILPISCGSSACITGARAYRQNEKKSIEHISTWPMMENMLKGPNNKLLRKVILASSAGTMIEWYDFYIFGSLATILSTQFFPKENPAAAFLFTLAAFGVGFVIRPFGAIVFGRLGDMIGRKYTFLVTLLLMGGSTFAIGQIPGYETIGVFAPVIVFLLRAVQ